MISIKEWYLKYGHGPRRDAALREELCGVDQNSPQFEMFRYTPIEDLTAIYNYRHDPRLIQLVNDITQRQWASFLDTYQAIPEEAHFILLAAYRYIDTPQLSATQLADAFYFLSIAIDDPDYEVANHDDEHVELSAIRINAAQLSVEANHRLNLPMFDNPGQYGVITFMNENDEDDEIIDCYQLAPTAILEQWLYPAGNQKLTITVGLPTLKQHIEAIFNGQNLYPLLTPYSKSKHSVQYLHGVALKNGSAWAARYSAIHLANQNAVIKEYGRQFKHAFKHVILALLAIHESRPPIKSRLIDDGFLHTHLSQEADAEDLASRLIEQLLSLYVYCDFDMDWIISPDPNLFRKQLASHLDQTLGYITRIPSSYPHKNNVFNPANMDIQENAMQIAFNLIKPALSKIFRGLRLELNLNEAINDHNLQAIQNIFTHNSAIYIDIDHAIACAEAMVEDQDMQEDIIKTLLNIKGLNAAAKYAPMIQAQLETFQQHYPTLNELNKFIRTAVKYKLTQAHYGPYTPAQITLPIKKENGKEVLNLLRIDENVHAFPSSEIDAAVQILGTILHMLKNEKARDQFLGDEAHRTQNPLSAALLCTLSFKLVSMIGPHTEDSAYDTKSYADIHNVAFAHKVLTKDVIYWQTRVFILLKLLQPFNKSGEKKFEDQFEREPTLFHHALNFNPLKSIERATVNQQDVNGVLEAGQTALWMALANEQLAVALELLKVPGIDVNLTPDKPTLLPEDHLPHADHSPLYLAYQCHKKLHKIIHPDPNPNADPNIHAQRVAEQAAQRVLAEQMIETLLQKNATLHANEPNATSEMVRFTTWKETKEQANSLLGVSPSGQN